MNVRAMRGALVIVLALLLDACMRVGHIQQTHPVRTLKFTGSHRSVAECIHQRVGGQVQDEGFGQTYVIYDSVKRRETEGLTHYSITVRRTGADEGSAEWRIAAPARSRSPHERSPGTRRAPRELADEVVRDYWNPVEDCASRVKASS